MQTSPETRRTQSGFALWLRTGHWLPAQLDDPALEVKFNPYHDPTNGEFTFAPGSGVTAGMSRRSSIPKRQLGREDPRIVADENRLREKAKAGDPQDSHNYTLYKVRAGDTLTHLAATRVGITPEDLRWLNDLHDDRLQVGQVLKVPTQASLDEGKLAFDKVVALKTYMQAHAGQLPPDVAHVPSLDQQTFGPETRVEKRNGYGFTLDTKRRPRKIEGTITLAPTQARSRTAQKAAGGSDRLADDHGGHYIARRFNGPTDDFNHFAQNGSFNQSAYATLENQWARVTERGEKVHSTIVPTYRGSSRRPDAINVVYTIGGRRVLKSFPNSKSAKYEQ